MSIRKILIFTVLFLIQYSTSFASDKKVFLIHAKSSMKIDDAQICAVPNVAWSALNGGYRVLILFDASGVTAIKRGGLFGGNKTPLDRAKLPDRERKSLAEQLNAPLNTIPHDYGEYIHFLKGKGVELYANKTMMLLYKIDPGKIDKDITPVDLPKMVDIFESADTYVAY